MVMLLREHLDVLTARSTYLDDVKLGGEMFMVVVRSQYARARVLSVSVPRDAPLVLTWDDVRAYMPVRDVDRAKFVARMPVLADGVVNFVGQPVAAVIAEDRYRAVDLAEEVSVDYEPLPPVTSIEEALRGDNVIHGGASDNVSIDVTVQGGEAAAFDDADVVVSRRIYQSRVVANPMEPKGCIAYYDGDTLNMYVSSQSPFRIRSDVGEALDFPQDKIRVLSPPNVGGGFGNKVPAYPEYVLAAVASMKLKRPVKWVEHRKEHLVNPMQGRGVLSEVSLYAKRNGELIGLRGTVVVDLGAYNYSINTRYAPFIAWLSTGPYRMRAVSIRALGVYTNLPPIGPYRGAGRPEAALIHETLMEDLAEELGVDPAELRARNLAEDYYVTPLGQNLGRIGLREVFDRAYAHYRRLREEYPGKGISLVVFAEHIRVSPGETCRIRVENGTVKLFLGGIGPHGQAHASAYRLLASRCLGVPPEKVEVSVGTTEGVSRGVGSFGSRSVTAGGAAIVEACRQALERAGGRPVTDVEGLDVEVFFKGDDIYGSGAHVAVVDLDGELLRPRMLKYVAVDNVGNVIIRGEVEAQIVGGVFQGASQVFFEGVRFDGDGNPLYFTILDTGFPTAADLPMDIETELVEIPSDLPGGFRGVGEAGTTGGLAATFIALERALSNLTGRKVKLGETPATPTYIERLLRP